MLQRADGHATSGQPIDDEMVEDLVTKAEAGDHVEEIVARSGRPLLGSAPSTVESFRLDPELEERLARRAEERVLPCLRSSERHLGTTSKSGDYRRLSRV